MIEIAIDKNGDGFVGWDVAQTDALNRVIEPVTYNGMRLLVSNGTYSLDWHETDFGPRVITANLNAGVAGMYVGTEGGLVDDMPVVPEVQNAAGVWVRLAPGSSGSAEVQLQVFNQSFVSKGTNTRTITTDWQQIGLTFTPGPTETHIFMGVEKLVGTAAISVQIVGPMLVEGNDLPEAFNSGDATDWLDAITPDVLDSRWRLGMRRPFDLVAGPTTGQIIVDNRDGTYAPEQGLTRLEPNTRIKVRVTHDGVTTVVFAGWIDHVEPDPQGRTATLHLIGLQVALNETRVLTDLLTEVTPDAVLHNICDNEPLNRFSRSFRVSDTQFAYVGDTWDDGARAANVITQILEAERGRFFSDRTGQLIFYDRDYLPNLPVDPVAFVDAFEALDYAYGDQLLNWARVELRPRALGVAGSVVWTLNSAQDIPPNDCRVVLVRFRDENGDRMGATGLITPVATTDFTANTAADGSGTDVTADVTMQFLSGGSASAVYLQICNARAETVYVQAGATVRGQPLKQGNPLLVEVRDEDSITAYGPRTLALNLPYLVTAEEAQQLAEVIVFLRKRPAGAVRQLTLSNRIRYADALTLTLFDQVRVQETRTGHLNDYFIVAEDHHIDMGGQRHRVTWTLEPINPGGIWKLDVDGLDTSTRLGVRF